MNNPATVAAQRKQVQRDRATIQDEVRKLGSLQSSQGDKNRAIATISKVVLKGTGLGADGNSAEMLGRLTVDLVANPGTVVGLGIQEAIKLKVSPEDAASIPEKVVQRLKKLV